MSDGPNDSFAFDAATGRVGMLLKGKWTIDRLLGAGGMASVYLATHRNGSKVAVKILHTHLAAHPDTLRRFLREGYLSNKVEHPDVVHVLDDDVAPDGSPFLVMELLDGRSLDSILEDQGPFMVREAVDIVARVLLVLEAAHAKGIVHRDLKPANIFLLKNQAIKVLDFGIARLHEMTASHNATQGGAVLGTPAFMPPEQARGRWEDVDARSDLWAMGATLFMLLTNRSVRDEAETANEALLYAMSKPVGPMAELVPALPAPIGSVIDRSLAFDSAARWPSATTMRDALLAALESAGQEAGATIIDFPRTDPMQTGAAVPFVHVPTPAGLGPGGVLAGTTPSSMPPPMRNGPPLPMFTAPRPLVAPATTPQFDLRSLTPTGTSRPSSLPPPRPPFASAPGAPVAAARKPAVVAIAGLVALAVAIVGVVVVAAVMAREDRSGTSAAHASAHASESGTESARASESARPSESAKPAEAASTIVIGDAPNAPASSSAAASASAVKARKPPPASTVGAATGQRPAPGAPTSKGNPLDQGRF